MQGTETPFCHVEGLWKVFNAPKGLDVHDAHALEAARAQKAVVAVQDVTFDVRRGELFVLMGLSGSGKSTLARCLVRLVEPTAGRMWVAGEEVTGLSKDGLIEFRRHKVAVVFQHYGLLPHRTVLENASFGLKLRGVRREEREQAARQMLEVTGLAKWEQRYPHELSGGMRQRVGIARALAQDPDVLILDEPFSGLDPLIRREMQDELLRLQEQFKKTIIAVTHDLQEASKLGDRMAIMRGGSIVQIGSPREIMEHPADDYVARFVQDEEGPPRAGHARGGRMEPALVELPVPDPLRERQAADK